MFWLRAGLHNTARTLKLMFHIIAVFLLIKINIINPVVSCFHILSPSLLFSTTTVSYLLLKHYVKYILQLQRATLKSYYFNYIGNCLNKSM